MIVCNLTKPESTLDQVKKTYPKIPHTDAALIASAIVMSGRYAKAVYEGEEYVWPEQYEALTQAMMRQLHAAHAELEPVKKTKNAEEEPVEIKLGLVPNFQMGEIFLGDRGPLKTLFSDSLKAGLEFQYTGQDIGWQWALDRANWATLSDGEFTRHIKFKATFEGDAVGIEMGLGGTKKKAAKKAAPKPEPEPVEEHDASEDDPETGVDEGK